MSLNKDILLICFLLSVSVESHRWMLVDARQCCGSKTISLLGFLTVKVSGLSYMPCKLGPGGLSVECEHVPEVSFTSGSLLLSHDIIKLY